MDYTIQANDTIAAVTRRLGTDWETLRKSNPSAVGRSAKTGNWFLKAGARVSVPTAFQEVLAEKSAQRQIAAKPRITSSAKPPAEAGATIEHVLRPGETVWELAVQRYGVKPEEIMRLNRITDPSQLQVGQKLRIPAARGREARSQEVIASWYGTYHHGRTMANGDPFDMHAATIAHRQIPLGTEVELENPKTGQKARAVVTDRGPHVEGRDIDLTYGLAKRLSLAREGVGNLRMRVL